MSDWRKNKEKTPNDKRTVRMSFVRWEYIHTSHEASKATWQVWKESANEVPQSCPTLCDPLDCSLPGSSIPGIFQARILEWVAVSFSRGSSPPRDWTWVTRTAGRLYHVSYQGSLNLHQVIAGHWRVLGSEAVRYFLKFSQSVQSLNHVWLFATPWTAAYQALLSITNSQSLLKLMSTESVMPSNHLILCHPLLLPPSIFPSIRVFSVFLKYIMPQLSRQGGTSKRTDNEIHGTAYRAQNRLTRILNWALTKE